MTEEQGQEWRRLKAEASERLASEWEGYADRWKDMLDATDERIWLYLSGVADDMDGHNLYELLAVLRFFDLLGRYAWNAQRVRHFFKFYETIRFSGATGRQRYKLTPVQAFQFASIFGFMREDGLRLCRTAYLFVPRKFGKTTSVASLAVYDLLFGDSNAQAYVGANSYNQAKVCFDEIRAIMRDIDPRARHFRVNREVILYQGSGRSSFARCLSANPKTLDGLNASTVIMDEYAAARDTKTKGGADLKNVLTSSMGVRREPLTVVITTASDVLDGPFRHELEGVMKVLRRHGTAAAYRTLDEGDGGTTAACGEGEEGEAKAHGESRQGDSVFASLFMPDYGDAEDDPHTWAKVQPHLGVTVRHDFYQMEWEAAQLSAEAMKEFRTKQLNVFVENEEQRWMTREQAEALMDEPGKTISRVAGLGPCMGGIDLSVRDDMSAVAYLGFSSADRCFHCHIDYYMPREAVARHANRALYESWHAAGYLRYCDGDVIDDIVILNDIIAMGKQIDLRKMAYDRYKAMDLVNMLMLQSGKGAIVPYSQTIGSFNLPVEMFEKLAFVRPPRIRFDYNPITVWQLTNCVMMEDNMENRKPFKAAPDRKIDGIVCTLMCLGLAGQ